MKVVVTKDYTEMCKLASRIFAAQITLKPDSVLGLATGSTPVGMYKELIQMYNEGRVDFSHVKTVNLDEYAGLNGDNDQSYRYFMNHNLFDHINIDKAHTHVPCGTGADHSADAKHYDEMIEALAQGRCVVNKFGQWLLTINGSFDGKKSDFRSTENKITVMFTPSATLLKALENIYVNADVATVGPMIESLTDSTTKEKNLHITPNAPAIIFGSTLLIKGDDPSVGVYFTKDEEGATPVKVSLIVRNTKSEIIIQIPPLAEGQYWLSVTTQAGAGYSLVKDPRTYKFPILLTVGVGGGGDSESPDEI